MQLESFESGSLSFPYISILFELVCFHPFWFTSRLGLGMLRSQQQKAIFQAFPMKQIDKIVYNSWNKLTRCQALMLFFAPKETFDNSILGSHKIHGSHVYANIHYEGYIFPWWGPMILMFRWMIIIFCLFPLIPLIGGSWGWICVKLYQI